MWSHANSEQKAASLPLLRIGGRGLDPFVHAAPLVAWGRLLADFGPTFGRLWVDFWPTLGLANRSEGLGAGLARALSIKVRVGGRALSIKVRGWGPGRPGPARPEIL